MGHDEADGLERREDVNLKLSKGSQGHAKRVGSPSENLLRPEEQHGSVRKWSPAHRLHEKHGPLEKPTQLVFSDQIDCERE